MNYLSMNIDYWFWVWIIGALLKHKVQKKTTCNVYSRIVWCVISTTLSFIFQSLRLWMHILDRIFVVNFFFFVWNKHFMNFYLETNATTMIYLNKNQYEMFSFKLLTKYLFMESVFFRSNLIWLATVNGSKFKSITYLIFFRTHMLSIIVFNWFK